MRYLGLSAVLSILLGLGACTATGASSPGDAGVRKDAGSGGDAGTPSNVSDLFPYYAPVPAITSYVSGGTFKHTYYCAPNGDDVNGDGTKANPWFSVVGAVSGGANPAHAIGPGDNLQFRGGVYTFSHPTLSWKHSYYDLSTSGTATDYIVLSAYPGETPIFEPDYSYHPKGGEPGDAIVPLQFSAHYAVVDGITFKSAPITVGRDNNQPRTDHIVVQDCTFDGQPTDATNDQIAGTFVLLFDTASQVKIINNYFDFSPGYTQTTTVGHAIKNYTAPGSLPNDSITIKYNRFYNNNMVYGIISDRGGDTNWVIDNNLFDTFRCAIGLALNYNITSHNIDIGFNAFDTIINPEIGFMGSGDVVTYAGNLYSPISGMNIHDNLTVNMPTKSKFLEHGTVDAGGAPLGEVYNNAFATFTDLFRNGSSDNVNIPDYWNFNAYPATGVMSTVENPNSLPAAKWQGSAVVEADYGITRTGPPGNRRYQITRTSPLYGTGRGTVDSKYSRNVGGFVFH